MSATLSPETYAVVQAMRRGFVAAAEAGYYGSAYWPEQWDSSDLGGVSRDGSRLCVLQRYRVTTGDAVGLHAMFEIAGALEALGYTKSLVQINDHEGYAATVSVLDRLLTECRPSSLRELNEREAEKLL